MELTFVAATLCYCHYLPFSYPLQTHGHALSIHSALISIESLSRSSFGSYHIVPFFTAFRHFSVFLLFATSVSPSFISPPPRMDFRGLSRVYFLRSPFVVLGGVPFYLPGPFCSALRRTPS